MNLFGVWIKKIMVREKFGENLECNFEKFFRILYDTGVDVIVILLVFAFLFCRTFIHSVTNARSGRGRMGSRAEIEKTLNDCLKQITSHLNFKTKSRTFAKEKKSFPKGGKFYCLETTTWPP